ncbi:MAG TPA: metal-dependent hydrolase [Planctomycetota bacterium]|nr:metal-dependent hydrolase [Planctomycetota bacterium]
MTPPAHFLAAWLVANAGGTNRRDRTLITIAGVLPDLDGFGYLPEALTASSAEPLHWYGDWHHVLFHNGLTGLVCAGLVLLVARQRWRTALLVLAAFHVHMLMDLAGSKGPDGDQWEIPYLLPFSDAWQLTWSGQWPLDSWTNKLIGVGMLAAAILLARIRGFSPFEIVSARADRAFVGMLRRSGHKGPEAPPPTPPPTPA